MATRYICKCGREVSKSTNADNTGNRDTTECTGCPYLMPWGEQKYNHDTKHFYLDVQGYECRMSPTIEYDSRFSGSVTDKCSCYVASLDFDFLQRVSDWIKATYPDGQISGSFNPASIRAGEYVSNGRYRMSITCAQNKSGIAAKAALLNQFFDDGGHRLDMSPEAEKEKILQDIRRGIDIDSGPDALAIAEQDHEEDCAMLTTYKDPNTNILYRVAEKPYKESYFLECLDRRNSVIWKGIYTNGNITREGEQAYLDAKAKSEGWVSEDLSSQEDNADSDKLPEPCDRCICPDCVHTDCTDKAECDQARSHWSANQRREECLNETGDCGGFMPRPTFSAAAAAAIDTTAEGQELSGVDSTTAATGAASSGETDDAPGGALVSSTGSAVATTAFDYSGLDVVTVDTLHVAERLIREARQKYITDTAQAVSLAHEELVAKCDNSKYGNRGEDTFRAWCASVGINKDTAYRLLQVNALLNGSTPDEQAVLEQAPTTLLYAAAKPSAPAELVDGVKSGDITTHKQYQELLAELEATKKKNEELFQVAHDFHVRADKAEADRNQAIDQQGEYAARVAEAERKVKELESRPIETTATDADELDRLALEKAQTMTAMYKAQINSMQEQNDDLARQLESSDVERYNHARDIVDAFLLQIKAFRESFWRVAGPLSEEDFNELMDDIRVDAALLVENDWSDFKEN